MFEPFQKFFDKAARNYGMKKAVDASHVCHVFRKIMPEIFTSEKAKENISPASFQENYLLINVKSPAWAQEVMMKKALIIEKLNENIGKQMVKNLRTQFKNY